MKNKDKRTIRVRFSQGVFVPLEKIDILEGKEFVITIPDESKEKNLSDDFEETAGSWKDTIDCEKLIKDIYADRSLSTRKKPSL